MRSFFYATRADGQPFTFSHKGQEYRLYRRVENTTAPYYFDFRRGGKPCGGCLKTHERELAVKRARARIDDVELRLANAEFGIAMPGAQGTARPTTGKVATLGEIEAVFVEQAPGVNIKQSSIANAVGALRRVVRRALAETPKRAPGTGAIPGTIKANPTKAEYAAVIAAVRAQSSAILTGSLVKDFQRQWLAGVPERDTARRQRALRSINHEMDNLKIMFTAEWLTAYSRAGLRLPDLREFLNEPLTQPTKQKKEKPPRDLLVRTFAAAPQLLARDPNAYFAWRLGCYSMRRGDISRARRDWLFQVEEYDDLDFTRAGIKRWVLEWPASKGERLNRVPLPDDEAMALIAHWEKENQFPADFVGYTRERERLEAHLRREEPYLIKRGQGGRLEPQMRCQAVFARVNDWMRALGWKSQHTLHEMRALYARRRRAQLGDGDTAALRQTADEMGHRDQRLTAERYTGEVSLANERVVIRLPAA